MATNNDVLNLKNVNGVLHNRKAVEIGMNNQVSHIAVNKQFARFKTRQTFGGDTAVRTSNPEKARVLRLREFSKKSGVFLHQHF
ncbi:Uncharacterised protein [Enterobacter hormaechei]|nr:Uncharacterised protein [Enterobacter hormaechei]SAF77354.1 Uncharacterised protein [Enterobacter cloacae]